MSCLGKHGRGALVQDAESRAVKRTKHHVSRKRRRPEREQRRQQLQQGIKVQRTDVVNQPSIATRRIVPVTGRCSSMRDKRPRSEAYSDDDRSESEGKRTRTDRSPSPSPIVACRVEMPTFHIARTDCKSVKSTSWNEDDDEDDPCQGGGAVGRIGTVIVQTGMSLVRHCWSSSLVRWATNLCIDGNPFDKSSSMHSTWKRIFDFNNCI